MGLQQIVQQRERRAWASVLMRCPVVRFGVSLANLTAQANPPTLTPTISAWALGTLNDN